MEYTQTRVPDEPTTPPLVSSMPLTSSDHTPTTEKASAEVIFSVADVTVTYGSHPAIRNVSMDIYRNEITALIGPSGCGKSTFIRCFNRMNDLIPDAKVHGTITYGGQDLYAKGVDPVEVRRRIGMVFQKP